MENPAIQNPDSTLSQVENKGPDVIAYTFKLIWLYCKTGFGNPVTLFFFGLPNMGKRVGRVQPCGLKRIDERRQRLTISSRRVDMLIAAFTRSLNGMNGNRCDCDWRNCQPFSPSRSLNTSHLNTYLFQPKRETLFLTNN